jgi:ABC-type arginine transport system permease subunit
MKEKIQFKKYTLMIGLLALTSLGIYLAFYLYRYYGVIARGISGVALVCLLFFFGKRSNLDVSIDYLLSNDQKGKYFISAFVAPILFWFAFAQIYEMILFLLK